MPTAVGLPTADALVAARKQTSFHCAFIVPLIAAVLSQSPELLDYCSTQLEHIYYAGGDLPQLIGDRVAAKLPLMMQFGATEIGLLNQVHSPNRDPLVDWHYLEFHPDIGMEFRHISGGEYEAVMVRSPTREAYQCSFVLFLKPQLDGVVNLINFISQSDSSPRLFFVSSMSSVMGDATNTEFVPETLITTTSPAPNGYANSKSIAEHLLNHAVQKGITCSFARVGQIAGPIQTPGLWNKSEWFAAMILSSLYLGALPDTLGSMDRIDWLPIDRLSEIIIDLGLVNSSESALNVYHLLNLHPQSWPQIKPLVVDAVSNTYEKSLETIPLQEWVLRGGQDSTNKALNEAEILDHLQSIPAVKLLEFFAAIVAKTPENILDTKATAQASEKLREVDAIKAEWIHKWVQGWSVAKQIVMEELTSIPAAWPLVCWNEARFSK